jgi:hypothetical protein
MSIKKIVIKPSINLILLCWIIFLLFYYKYIFGGDPEIHLIFAKNLLQGHILEFNPGHKTGGESSPLYMVLVAGMYLLTGDYAPYLMKLTGVSSLLFLAFFIYKSTKSKDPQLKIFAFTLFGSMTFIPFQSLLGMENVLFAAIILAITYLHSKKKLSNITIAIVVPLTFMLRPEGIFLSAYFFLIGLVSKKYQLTVVAFLAGLLCVIIYAILNHYSGVDLHNAASMRAVTSKINAYAFNIGSTIIYINIKPIITFSYAWILLSLFIFYRQKLLSGDYLLLVCFVAIPFGFHLLNVFPNTHLSRYAIYCYAVIFFVFAQRILPHMSDKSLIVLSIIFLLIATSEFKLRKNLPSFNVSESVEQLSLESIKKKSDYFVALLSKDVSFPIVIATTEVQLRGRLDDRFLVWSLDGITDAALSKFAIEKQINHFSYINFREIKYLEDLPNYNIEQSKLSLKNFAFDALGKSQCLSGITLTKLASPKLYEINKCHLTQ